MTSNSTSSRSRGPTDVTSTMRHALRRALWGPEQNQAVHARLRSQLLGLAVEPVRVGRFVLLRRLGAGAMGVVHVGYDETLDRKVAIKLIGSRGTGSRDGQARMLREAQALAKLNHPNVVQIYEAGLREGRLFIAMEFVEGQTLRRWAAGRGESRTWRDVLSAYRQAGLGLAAAHEAGLVHRDFKPDNAMIDDAGRVRVLDFGLARRSEYDASRADDAVESEVPGASGPGALVTQTGSLVGTPAYMAPEQLGGGVADARSDQFSFCVSVWEAVYGQRPFADGGLAQRGASMLDGPQVPANLPAGLPDGVHQALCRGLCVDPSARWPDMGSLVAALQTDQRRRGRGALVVGATALVVAVVVGARLSGEQAPTPCASSAQHIEDVWDDARREQAQGAFSTIEAPFARAAWERTQRSLDAYADDWIRGHRQACEATTVHGEQSSAVMDLRMTCLHEAKRQLSSVVAVLATADVDVVRKAHDVVDSLPPLDRCEDVPALLADEEAPPAKEAAAIGQIRAQLATATAERAAGRYEAAYEAVQQAQRRVEEGRVSYGPVRGVLALELGHVLEARGELEASERALRNATRLTAQWGPREALADAVLLRMQVGTDRGRTGAQTTDLEDLAAGLVVGRPRAEARLSRQLGLFRMFEAKYEEAATHFDDAISILDAVAGPDDLDVAAVLGDLANLRRKTGDYDEAIRLQERANGVLVERLGEEHPAVAAGDVDLATTFHEMGKLERAIELDTAALTRLELALGPRHPIVADVSANLAGVHLDLGNYDEAGELLRRTLSIQETALGPEHPRLARNLVNLGNVHAFKGEIDVALELFERALPIRRRALGARHPDVADTLHNTASLYNMRGDFATGRPLLEQARAIWETALGPEHPRVAQCLDTLAVTLRNLGEYDEAIELFERALKLRKEVLGPDHPEVAQTLNNFGNLHLVRKEYDQAGRLHERALAIREKALGPDHPRVGQTLANLGAIRAEQGDNDVAAQLLERSLAILEKSVGPEHPGVANPLDNLAQLALKRGRAREAATWAERALRLREAGNSSPADLAGSRYLLAQALFVSRQDRGRAIALARQARDGYVELGDVQADRAAQVQAWLSTHQ